jgi:hypothetical protein
VERGRQAGYSGMMENGRLLTEKKNAEAAGYAALFAIELRT